MSGLNFTDQSEWLPTLQRVPLKQSSSRRPSSISSVDSGYSIRSGSQYFPKPPVIHRRPAPPLPLPNWGRKPPSRPLPPPPRRRNSSTAQPHQPTRGANRHRPGNNQGCPNRIIRRRHLVIMCCVSLTLSTFCLAMCGLSWVRSREESSTICVDCSGLNVSNIEAGAPSKDRVWKDHNGTCCVRTMGQFSRLILQILEQTQKKINCIRLSPSFNHVTFKPGSATTLGFNTGLKRFEGNYINDSRLHIELPGLYFIYSSVYFNPKSCIGTDKQDCEHLVLKESHVNTTLLRSVHKCCVGNFTSYAGGLFSLARGNTIFVNVTNASLVDFDTTMSYLGLMMVRSKQ